MGFYGLSRAGYYISSKLWLIGCSFWFYGYWNIRYVPLLGALIIFNYLMGQYLDKNVARIAINTRKLVLFLGISVDVSVLCYFKYTDFFLANLNSAFGLSMALPAIVLPLAISFFTFQKIAYLVDCYRGEVKDHNFLNFCLFVSFFPQLIAGPITHQKEILPQFFRNQFGIIHHYNIITGLFIFSLGLFKKVMIADELSIIVTDAFNAPMNLTVLGAWVASLAYSFQIYFDFSGYTDMAIGAALLFNIRLPQNFNSPYKALNIQDFWRRWHITLSNFLRDYIYIPLGGNKASGPSVARNIMVTFIIGGIWHGAGWTFLLWGIFHGLGLVVYRIYSRIALKPMPKTLAWCVTFNFINFTWIVFRAKDIPNALLIVGAMFGFNETHTKLSKTLPHILPIILCFILVLCFKNSNEKINDFKPTCYNALFAGFLAACAVLSLNRVTEFLYFNF